MFKLSIVFPGISSNKRPIKRRVTEDMFNRRLEGSQILQHMCGFDTELYEAINGLKS